MTPLPTMGFAGLSNLVYDFRRSQWGGFEKCWYFANAAGFAAGLYMRTDGLGRDFVLSYAGTDPLDAKDWLADGGFGGSTGSLGDIFLRTQIAAGLLAATVSQKVAGRSRLTLTGHSLGGGLAQIIAAYSGLPAVTFSAPGVSAVVGIQSLYQKKKPRVVNFRILCDPVNCSELVGKRIGRVITLPSPRIGIAAHSMDSTLKELSPWGLFSKIGQFDPFTMTAPSIFNY